jgi:hypothetical protein
MFVLAYRRKGKNRILPFAVSEEKCSELITRSMQVEGLTNPMICKLVPVKQQQLEFEFSER